MNVFYLSTDIDDAARFHVDKHVVKMPIEYAQLLCSVLHSLSLPAPYAETHKNHPCAVWARQSLEHYQYIWDLGDAVGREYTARYGGKIHKSTAILRDEIPRVIDLPSNGFTEPPNCTTLKDTNLPLVHVYRLYYLTEKAHLLDYKHNRPDWVDWTVDFYLDKLEDIMGQRFYVAQIRETGTTPDGYKANAFSISRKSSTGSSSVPAAPKKSTLVDKLGIAGGDKFTVVQLNAILDYSGNKFAMPDNTRSRKPYEDLFNTHLGFVPKAPVAAMRAVLEKLSS